MSESEESGSAKRSFYFLLAVVAVLLFSVAKGYLKKEPEWEPFRSTEGGFSVLTAGVPDQRRLKEELGSGKTEARYFTWSRGQVHYAVAYTDLPENFAQRTDADTVLTHAHRALAKRVQGKMLEETAAVLEKHPGVSCKIEAGDGSVLRARIFLVEGRIYTLMAGAADEGEKGQTEIDAFFNSFALLDRDK